MNIGDYVRTECGIAKIKNFETKNKEVIELDKDIMICNMDCYRNLCTINQVIKSSPNIIDLIEVGDYVNGCKVDYSNIVEKLTYEDKCIVSYDGDGDIHFFENDIESIVTKEMYSSVEYKIGSGKDE